MWISFVSMQHTHTCTNYAHNSCFKLLEFWWSNRHQRPLHTSFPQKNSNKYALIAFLHKYILILMYIYIYVNMQMLISRMASQPQHTYIYIHTYLRMQIFDWHYKNIVICYRSEWTISKIVTSKCGVDLTGLGGCW